MRKCNMRWFSPQKIKRQLAFVLAICLVCIVPVTTYAQILKISMKRTNVSIQNVIRELEQKSGYTFFYNDNQVKLTKKVSVDVTDAPIENVLDQIFNNSAQQTTIGVKAYSAVCQPTMEEVDGGKNLKYHNQYLVELANGDALLFEVQWFEENKNFRETETTGESEDTAETESVRETEETVKGTETAAEKNKKVVDKQETM